MESFEMFFILVNQMTACQDAGIEPLTCFQTMIEQLQQFVEKTEVEQTI